MNLCYLRSCWGHLTSLNHNNKLCIAVRSVQCLLCLGRIYLFYFYCFYSSLCYTFLHPSQLCLNCDNIYGIVLLCSRHFSHLKIRSRISNPETSKNWFFSFGFSFSISANVRNSFSHNLMATLLTRIHLNSYAIIHFFVRISTDIQFV